MEAIAEFDFVARDTDELSFQSGATLLVSYCLCVCPVGDVSYLLSRMEDTSGVGVLTFCQLLKAEGMDNNKYIIPFQITNLGEDENWFKAVLHRSEGYIPKNYVRFSIPSSRLKGYGDIGESL
eukprot:sb/3475842/